MASTIKLKNGSGAPTAGDLVQGEPALDLTNKRLYTEDAGGTVVEVGTNPTALTIGGTALTATATELNVLDGITATTAELNYTDGVTSNIQTQLDTKAPIASPTFTGTTTIPTADINGGTIDDTVIGGTTAAAGSFTTGQFDTSVNVDGTVTADGLTVDGSVNIDAAVPILRLDSPDTAWAGGEDLGGIDWYTKDPSSTAPAVIARIYSESVGANTLPIPEIIFQTTLADTVLKDRMKIGVGGDISFYEDTGTTPKLFWDASAESLGIGTSSPATVSGGIHAVHNATEGTPTAIGDEVGIFQRNFNSSQSVAVSLISGSASTSNIYFGDNSDIDAGKLSWSNSTNSFSFSGGNVGIGTDDPARKLSVEGGTAGFGDGTIETIIGYSTRGIIGTQSNHDLELRTNGAIKALLDTSGNLLVGTTTQDSGAKFTLNDQGVVGLSLVETGTTSHGRIYFKNGNGVVGQIVTDGSATAYNTSSDERLKENTTDAPAGNIDDIKVRSFDWKVDGSHQDYGMVAQELEAVAPYAVTKGETEDDMWSVDYSKLVPMLIKEIQDLKAEVAALKGAN